MKLTILGSCGGYPEPGRACSGFLVESDRTSIWVDAGAGTLDALLRIRSLDRLDGIILSHLHADHWTDLPIALHRLAVTREGGEIRQIPVYGPVGWPEGTGIASQWYANQSPPFLTEILDPESPSMIGDVTISATAVQHSMPTFALRFTDSLQTIVYSADSQPCDALVRIARGADLFLCEATLPVGQETRISMNPGQAAQIANQAGVRHLVLTHLLPGIDPAESCAVARDHFNGPVDHADQGRVFEIAPR